MIMAVELTVSKIGGGQRSTGSGHTEIDYNSLKCNLGLRILLNVNLCSMACLGGGLCCLNASSCSFVLNFNKFLLSVSDVVDGRVCAAPGLTARRWW